MGEPAPELVKVDARVTDDVAVRYGEYESLWAMPVGDGEFELRSIPLWVAGLAWGDVVRARGTSPAGKPLVCDVVRRGGHSTIMLAIEPDSWKAFDRAWKALEREGCRWECFSDTLRAVDIPPDANRRKVSRALALGVTNEIWTYEPLHVAAADDTDS